MTPSIENTAHGGEIQLAKRVFHAGVRGGDAVAAVDGDRRGTFRQIHDRTNRLANALAEFAAGPARVAIMLPNSLEAFEGDLAAVKAGLTKVPINQRLVADERAYVLGNSGAKVLITDQEGYASVEGGLSELPELETILIVGENNVGQRSYEDVLSSSSDRPPEVDEDPNAPSVILYTSGTTGRPKGAVASIRNRWETTVAMLSQELEIGSGDAMVHTGSMAHGERLESTSLLGDGCTQHHDA